MNQIAEQEGAAYREPAAGSRTQTLDVGRRKNMRITQSIVILTILIVGSNTLMAADKPDTRAQQERTQWVRKCMDDFATIKSGMTRAQVQQLFQMDGGVQGFETVRYLHSECPYFMVDVTYSVKRNDGDQGRLVHSQEDKVVLVSKPYLKVPSRN